MADAQPQAGTVDGGQLSQLLGISDRELRDHAARGVVIRTGRNRYDFVRSVQGYVKHLRELAAGHKSSGGMDNQNENALFTRERRRKLQLEGETAAGKLIPVELVEAVMVDHIKGIRGMLLGISNECQSEMPHLPAADLMKIREISEKVLRDNALRVVEDTKMHPEVQQFIDEKRGVAPI